MVRIQDAFVTTCSLGMIVGGLAWINSDARRHIGNIVAGNVGDLAAIAAPIDQAARVAMKTLSDYQSDNGPMFAFGAAAVVLFGLLFKS